MREIYKYNRCRDKNIPLRSAYKPLSIPRPHSVQKISTRPLAAWQFLHYASPIQGLLCLQKDQGDNDDATNWIEFTVHGRNARPRERPIIKKQLNDGVVGRL